MSETTVIPVTGNDPYDITIGRGLLANLSEQIGTRVAKVLIVHQPSLGAKANALRDCLALAADCVIAFENDRLLLDESK